MADRPILFSAPMVRALLDGRKTQTRRLHKVVGEAPRFAVGDRLWVREAWAPADRMYHSHDLDVPAVIAYPADKSGIKYWGGAPNAVPDYDVRQWNFDALKKKPGIHMPRWASRLTLTVTDVRVQRLQEISEEDCGAEGITKSPDGDWYSAAPETRDPALAGYSRRGAFYGLWSKINGAASWDANPWIVALTFTVEKRNIDQVPT